MKPTQYKGKGKASPRVIILGGGFAGLETALYIRGRMPDYADITLVSDKDHFLFKPNTIYIPFGLDPRKLAFHLSGPTRRRNIGLVNATAREIDPISGYVIVEEPGRVNKIAYDYLVVATGAGMNSDEIPGLSEFGTTVWTQSEMLSMRAGFQKLVADAKDGRNSAVLFLVPPNNRCSGPLYEMVMMLDTWLRRKRVRERVSIVWSTFEGSYIEAFGPRMHRVVTEEFEQRGIDGRTRYVVDRIERGEAVYTNGERLHFDLLVSFPPHVASTHFMQLPADDRGFISTDLRTRQVVGYPAVYAVGDTADFPLKQANLAFLQAEAAADHLIAKMLGKEPTVEFDPVRLRISEGREMATVAQVPFPTPSKQEVLRQAGFNGSDIYKAGSSPVWRLGKMALGLYLPWRFKAGNPFHSGVPWKGIEAGLNIMAAAPVP